MDNGQLLIPRIIHRIWLGSDAMPEEFEFYGETWRRNHPDWEFRLWTDSNLPRLSCAGALERGRHEAERSNVLRYELLRQFGGVYVDTDFECLRPIDPLLRGVTAFAADMRPGEANNAILGAVPGHPLFDRAVREAESRVGRFETSRISTGPKFLRELLEDFPEVTIFPPERFYPYKWYEPERARDEFPEAYAVHHWAKTWDFEGSEPEEKVDYLRKELARLQRHRMRAVRQRQKAERRADSAERRAVKAERALQRAESRLAALEGSRWWRLRPPLFGGVRARESGPPKRRS